MTVQQLMAHLADMPQDAEVCLEILGGNVGYVEVSTSSDGADLEIFECADGTVCIQALQ